jgi:hypothetical protein
MEVALHNHPVLPPTVPFARAKGGDVQSQRLAPTLEVVGPQVCGTPPGGSQRKEEPEQAHQRPHAHIHFTEVDKDLH